MVEIHLPCSLFALVRKSTIIYVWNFNSRLVYCLKKKTLPILLLTHNLYNVIIHSITATQMVRGGGHQYSHAPCALAERSLQHSRFVVVGGGGGGGIGVTYTRPQGRAKVVSKWPYESPLSESGCSHQNNLHKIICIKQDGRRKNYDFTFFVISPLIDGIFM